MLQYSFGIACNATILSLHLHEYRYLDSILCVDNLAITNERCNAYEFDSKVFRVSAKSLIQLTNTL